MTILCYLRVKLNSVSLSTSGLGTVLPHAGAEAKGRLINLLEEFDYTQFLSVKIFIDIRAVPTFITSNESRRRSWNIDMKSSSYMTSSVQEHFLGCPLFEPAWTLGQRVSALSIIPFAAITWHDHGQVSRFSDPDIYKSSSAGDPQGS